MEFPQSFEELEARLRTTHHPNYSAVAVSTFKQATDDLLGGDQAPTVTLMMVGAWW